MFNFTCFLQGGIVVLASNDKLQSLFAELNDLYLQKPNDAKQTTLQFTSL